MKKRDIKTITSIIILAILVFNILILAQITLGPVFNKITGAQIIGLDEAIVLAEQGSIPSTPNPITGIIEIQEPIIIEEQEQEENITQKETEGFAIQLEEPTVIQSGKSTIQGFQTQTVDYFNLTCAVQNRSTCAGTIILGMYNLTNSHAELANMTNYSYGICCNSSSNIDINTTNTGNNQSYEFLHLSNTTNAHVEFPNETNYTHSAFISVSENNITCSYPETYGSCPTDYACLATVSTGPSNGTTNMHIADCTTNPYNTSICCAIIAGVNLAPNATITSPSNNSYQQNTSEVTFTGTGEDDSDGTLTGDSLVWFSDIDGNFGNGTSVNANLTVGGHNITLNATDSEGLIDSERIIIHVVFDEDLDGVQDNLDTLNYNSSYVNTTGVTNLNITVNGSSTINGVVFSDQHDIAFLDSTNLLFNFSHNFTLNSLDLSKISIEVTSNSTVVNMSGQLNTSAGETKTLFLADNDFDELCAADLEISSQAQITSYCNETGEYNFTSCLGVSTGTQAGPLTCYDMGSTILIENFTYSGVKGSPAPAAAPTTTPTTGGGGGGSSVTPIVCVENWECTVWSNCADDSKIRTCTDKNNCGTSKSKPPAQARCISPLPTPEVEEVKEEIVEEVGKEIVEEPVIEKPIIVEEPDTLQKILEYMGVNSCSLLTLLWTIGGLLILLILLRAVRDKDKTKYLIRKNNKQLTIFFILMGIAIIITLLKCIKVSYIIALDIIFIIMIIRMLSKKPGDIRMLIFDFERAHRAKDIKKSRELYRKIYIRYRLLSIKERRKIHPMLGELKKFIKEMKGKR